MLVKTWLLIGFYAIMRVIKVRIKVETLALQSKIWQDFFSAMAERWKNLKDTTAFSSFIVC